MAEWRDELTPERDPNYDVKGFHACVAPSGPSSIYASDYEWRITCVAESGMHGPAITSIRYASGVWWALASSEYATVIQFCPFCGVRLLSEAMTHNASAEPLR